MPEVKRRIRFEFTGSLDDVPADVAAALARVVRRWSSHADQHATGLPTARIALTGNRLSVEITDPACSPACLYALGAPTPSVARPPSELLMGRSSVRRTDDGGLCLGWWLAPVGPHARHRVWIHVPARRRPPPSPC